MTSEETPLDVQIRRLEKNLAEVRKRTQVINLQHELLREEQKLSAAQARFDATKSLGLALPSQTPTTVTTVQLRETSDIAQANRSPTAAALAGPAQSTSHAVSGLIDSVRSSNHQSYPAGDPDRAQSDRPAPVEEDLQNAESGVEDQLDDEEYEDESVASEMDDANDDLDQPLSVSMDVDDDSSDSRHGDRASDDGNGTSNAEQDISKGKSISSRGSVSGEESTLDHDAGQSAPPAHQQTESRPMSSFPATPYQNMNGPPLPSIALYQAQSWKECKSFIALLEGHFAKYQSYYTEIRKVELGARFLASNLKDNWHHYVVNMKRGTTWDSVRIFLARQTCREASRGKALAVLSSARQRHDESVSDFALWIKRWEPALENPVGPNISEARYDCQMALYKGILPSISQLASPLELDLEDYSALTGYLQQVENRIPERRALIRATDDASVNSDASQDDSAFVAFPSSPVSRAPTAPRTPSQALHRSPPTGPRASRDQSPLAQQSDRPIRRLSPAAPEPPPRRLYEGKSWWECKDLIGFLTVVFAKNTIWYNDSRKLDVAVQQLSKELRKKWIGYSRTLKKPSWMAYRLFLARQVPYHEPYEITERTYFRSQQKETDSVTDFALHIQRVESHLSLKKGYNIGRHLYDRILPIVRRNADQECKKIAWKKFPANDLPAFVEFLQHVEDNITARQRFLKERGVTPRKRARED